MRISNRLKLFVILFIVLSSLCFSQVESANATLDSMKSYLDKWSTEDEHLTLKFQQAAGTLNASDAVDKYKQIDVLYAKYKVDSLKLNTRYTSEVLPVVRRAYTLRNQLVLLPGFVSDKQDKKAMDIFNRMLSGGIIEWHEMNHITLYMYTLVNRTGAKQ